MQLQDFLTRSAERLPDKTFLVCGGRQFTYAGVDQASSRLARRLLAEGLQRGDRVAICLENSFEAVAAIFGALKADGIFMPINPTTKAEKLLYILNNSRAAVLITSAAKLAEVEGLPAAAPALKWVFCDDGVPDGHTPVEAADLGTVLREGDGTCPPRRNIDIDLAALIYTSGSTGNSKGVMLTHLNMVAAATSITTYLQNREDDIILSVLPLSFDYGLYQVLMAAKFGGTVVLERSMAYPYVIIERLIEEKVTGFPVVPTVLSILFRMDLSQRQFPHLRYVTNTGAALPVAHIRRLRSLFPHVRLYSMYGLTECKRVAYLPPELVDEIPESVGHAMPNVEVYIVDELGNRLPPGRMGELVVRGSNVMKGYWELPEETAKVLKPGPVPGEMVLYTGDLFVMDERGFLYFRGRRDDLIKSRGEKVSPREVENVLYSLEGIADAAVIGVPDPVLGQAVQAFVSLKEGCRLTEREILRHCAGHLEDFMVPKHVEIRPELPKNPSGKIDKRRLAGG
ncbi:MAG: AMP-binding protein [Acidobacteriota bacterium]